MTEPTGCVRCCVRGETYCDRCDLLVGLPGLHVIEVVDDRRRRLDGDGRVAAGADGLPGRAG